LLADAQARDLLEARRMLALMKERGMAPERDLAAGLRAAQSLVRRLDPGAGLGLE